MLVLRVDVRGRLLDRLQPEAGDFLPFLQPGSTILPLVAESAAGTLLDVLLNMRRRPAVWSWPLAASSAATAAAGWNRVGLVAIKAPLAALVGIAGDPASLLAVGYTLLSLAQRALDPPASAQARAELGRLLERASSAERTTLAVSEPQRNLVELLAERGREVDRLSSRVAELECQLRQR